MKKLLTMMAASAAVAATGATTQAASLEDAFVALAFQAGVDHMPADYIVNDASQGMLIDFDNSLSLSAGDYILSTFTVSFISTTSNQTYKVDFTNNTNDPFSGAADQDASVDLEVFGRAAYKVSGATASDVSFTALTAADYTLLGISDGIGSSNAGLDMVEIMEDDDPSRTASAGSFESANFTTGSIFAELTTAAFTLNRSDDPSTTDGSETLNDPSVFFTLNGGTAFGNPDLNFDPNLFASITVSPLDGNNDDKQDIGTYTDAASNVHPTFLASDQAVFTVEATVVPVPAAIGPATAMAGLLGVGAWFRRRRQAV